MNYPETFLDLLADDSTALLYLATVMSDGSPQVTPVWFNREGDYILINTAEGRIKDRNMKKRPRVAITIQDPKDPYRYLGIRGEVVGYTREGADEHINWVSFKYDHKPRTPKPGERRIIFKIKPTGFDPHN
jgi:PPOX class probable F420-dependent enzyme